MLKNDIGAAITTACNALDWGPDSNFTENWIRTSEFRDAPICEYYD